VAATQALKCPLNVLGNITLIYSFDTTARRRPAGCGKFIVRFVPRLVNRSVGATIALIALIAGTGIVAPGRAMAAGGLPANVVTSTQPPAGEIEAYIAQALFDLKSPDPAKQQSGRDAIVNFAGASAQPPVPSPAFLSAYSRTLNRQLPAITKATDMRSRLNAAVATARIAEKIDNDELVGTITELLKDQNEAVAIWALKAAKFVVPRSANGAKLIKPIVDTAKRFPGSTTMAYQALSNSPTPNAAIIDAIHSLMDVRIASYANDIPADPLAELVGMNTIVDTKWWGAQTPAQQQKTLQLLVNLVSVAGQRMGGAVSNENRESMASLIRLVARGIGAIGIKSGKDPLAKKLDDATKGLGKASSAQQIAQSAETVVKESRSEFPAVAAPPQIAGAPGAAQPPGAATKPSPTTK